VGTWGVLTLRPMAVLMILQDGPLDAEQQMVEMVPTTPGSQLGFNIPWFQTFDPDADAEVVMGLGLQAVYTLVGQGPAPNPDVDRWDTSWIFEFAGDVFVPTPEALPVPPNPQVDVAQVWMSAETSLVPDTLPITTSPVVVLVAESAMDVEATTTPTQAGVVVMTGETTMPVTPDWSPLVTMNGQSSMEVDPS
jgi:hypothetical protein